MGAAKQFLDMAADFLMFIAACAFVIGGFSNTARIQTALDRSLTDKGTSVISDVNPSERVSAEEVAALLLFSDGMCRVTVDGVAYTTNRMDSIEAIQMDREYLITRESTSEGIKLTIKSIGTTEGGGE